MLLGSKCNLVIGDMKLGNETITCCKRFKYLGVTFLGGRKLKLDTDFIKQKFFLLHVIV